MAMTLTPADRELLRGVGQGISAGELAARLGIPEVFVHRRLEVLINRLTAVPSKPPSNKHPRIASARLAPLHDLWLRRRGSGGLPSYGALRITDLQPWMDSLGIVELVGPDRRPRVRLLGRKVLRVMAIADPAGRFLEDYIPDTARDAAVGPYTECATSRAPQYDVLLREMPGGRNVRFHRLLLPHASDGRNVDLVVVGAHLEAAPEDERAIADRGIYSLLIRKAG